MLLDKIKQHDLQPNIPKGWKTIEQIHEEEGEGLSRTYITSLLAEGKKKGLVESGRFYARNKRGIVRKQLCYREVK